MATTAALGQVRGAEDDSGGLLKQVEQHLSDIFQEAECSTAPGQPGVLAWFYRIPCPGVRYYSYEDGPFQQKPTCSSSPGYQDIG